MIKTHGRSRTPEYKAWIHMRERCTNPNTKAYHNYGGRGITVCKEWDSFENFYADMNDRPSNKHSLDRKDNNGNYEPSNCQWATRIVQNRNKRAANKNTSGIVGVTRIKNSWLAQIGVSKKNIYLYFGKDFFEACCRRKAAELAYWSTTESIPKPTP